MEALIDKRRSALAINRPSKEQFETVKGLSKRADELTDAATNLNTITDIANEASRIMAAIHSEIPDTGV
jgi:hypothetical protein